MKFAEEEKQSKNKMHAILVERIENLCKEKGISIYQLALETEIPMTTFMHIIDGTSKNPGIFTVMKICEGLEISLSEFFDDEGFHMLK